MLALKSSKKVHIIRYEDALENPVPTFLALAKYLNLPTSKEEIIQWHKKNAHRELYGGEGHYQGGGANR